LTFKDALAMLRGNQSEDLQKFIFQEASQELTKNDKTALGALSFFVPSSNFEAWVKVAGLTPNALETTIDRLSALSLVDVLPGQERYTLHPLTRAFVRDELLADGNIVYKIGMQFAQYWIDYAEQYGGSSENYKTFHLLLETEWANLDAAANWLWETTRLQVDEVGDKDTARILNGLAEALNHFLWFGGRWDECLRLSTRAYEAMGVLNDWSKAGWHAYHVTWIHYNRAHTNDATLWANRCTDVWTRGGSKSQLAYAMRLQGLVAQQRDDDAEAERLLRDALFTLRDLKQDAYVALLLNDLGSLARKRKLYDMAEGYLRESLGFLIETDDRQGQANVIITLGNLERDRVRWARARNWYEQGLAIAEEIERKELTAHALEGLARVYEAEGQTDLALPLAQDALKIYRQLQHQNMPLTLELVERLLQEKR
jgi:tetratricopeptide (TPR) repeat protein